MPFISHLYRLTRDEGTRIVEECETVHCLDVSRNEKLS